jgi:hypothetical protein
MNHFASRRFFSTGQQWDLKSKQHLYDVFSDWQQGG